MKKALCSTFFLFAVATTLVAQATQESRRVAPEEYVPRSYPISWRSSGDIYQLLVTFAGSPGIHKVAHNERLGAVTVIANEKGHAFIQDLIGKYDVPAKEIEFQFYMLKAGRHVEAIKDGVPERVRKVIKRDVVPEEVRKVIEDVAALTRYASFDLIDSPVVRATEGSPAKFGGKAGFMYDIFIGGPAVVSKDGGRQEIRLDDFQIRFHLPFTREGKWEPIRAGGIQTAFSIGDGETIVLGASRIQEEGQELGEAVITVVTARIIE